VRVQVDEAGAEEGSGSVDDGVAGQLVRRIPDRDDPAALDGDVGAARRAVAGDDLGAADDGPTQRGTTGRSTCDG
jgi:hypothetical protein